jgi:hypothetical protein
LAKNESGAAYIYKERLSHSTPKLSEPRNELYSTQIKRWPEATPNIDMLEHSKQASGDWEKLINFPADSMNKP